MKKFSTWMLVMFIVMFWAFRVMIAISAELNWEMGALKPLNTQVEIISMPYIYCKKEIDRCSCLFDGVWFIFWYRYCYKY